MFECSTILPMSNLYLFLSEQNITSDQSVFVISKGENFLTLQKFIAASNTPKFCLTPESE